jgi:(1->4)-alpha-D-glucan 1-alpha-D-glucosylmutase
MAPRSGSVSAELDRSRPAAWEASVERARLGLPSATYRIQFHAAFTFLDAAKLVPYLRALGITHCYCSSYLQAVPGSMHGYDVADPTRLNPELGTDADFRAFVSALQAHGMSHVLDLVPNHMGIAKSHNRWWQDVLENGPSSRFARVFDIDWQPIKRELAQKVLLPVLGDQYGAVLERQEIGLRYDDGAFTLHYFDTTLPSAPRSYVHVLRHRVDELTAQLGAEHPDLLELLSIITAIEHLPERSEQAQERIAERMREKEIIKRRLGTLVRDSAAIRTFVEENVQAFNGQPGVPSSFDLLDVLLNDQAYRLAHWRVAAEEINYRRFFDINELAAVRMEDPDVFEAAHALVLRLVREGAIGGLRIDHVDGLFDPRDYLRRLRSRVDEERPPDGPPVYVVVEKILAPDEPLPTDWPVEGTTGYDFTNAVNGLFVDTRHGRAMDDVYRRFTGERTAFADLAYRKKKLIMQVGMASEINVLAHRLNEFSEHNRHYRDFTLHSLIAAIREIIASFPVYRTYVTADDSPVSERDRRYIDEAVNDAKRRNPAVPSLVYDFIRDLLLKRADYMQGHEREEYRRFIMRFQQTTSPVTAKGIEDTALYIYHRLISLNEVGGEPSHFGTRPEDLHAWFARRQREWPGALSATSTHDTKRSEDVRARINVISENPGAWRNAVARWARANRRHRREIDGRPAPVRNDEYLLYQTLVGAWPLESLDGPPDEAFVERICQYAVKALREGKRHSSWISPNATYEDATTRFIRRVLDPRHGAAFHAELLPFVREVAHRGMWNSLSQVLLKVASPGVPDFYQGTELWDLSLVDPDNRRPVDYGVRATLLDRIGPLDEPLDPEAVAALVAERLDGRIKLYVATATLRARGRHPELFARGEYRPIEATGRHAAHVFAFARVHGASAALVVVPRLTTALVADATTPPVGESVWGDTQLVLPDDLPAVWSRVLMRGEVRARTGVPRSFRVADVLSTCPVALLATRSAEART